MPCLAFSVKIKKEIFNIEQETAKLRETKGKENLQGKEIFEFYFEAAEKLIGYVKKIDEYIPIITEFYNERINQENEQKNREKNAQKLSRQGLIWGIIGSIIGIIGLLYAYFK